MKFKKMMLVAFVLLAVLTIGAVSASDDVASDELAVDEGEVDVQLPQEDFDDVSTNENQDIIAVDGESNDVLGDGQGCTVNLVWNMMSWNGPVTTDSYSNVISQGSSWTVREAKFNNVIANYMEFDYEGDHYTFNHWEDESGNAISGDQVFNWAEEDYTVTYQAIYDIAQGPCTVNLVWNMMSSDGPVTSDSYSNVISQGSSWTVREVKFDNVIANYMEFDYDECYYEFSHWEDENENVITGDQVFFWADEDYTVNYYAIYDITEIVEGEPVEDFEFYLNGEDDEEAVFEISENTVVASLLISAEEEFENAVVTITVTVNGQPFDTIVSSDVEDVAYISYMNAYEYPIALDLTKLNDKDLLAITLDCFDEDDVWEYAIEIDDGNALFHWYEEIPEFYVFYGNITTGDLNDPDMMGPHPDGNFIELSIPDAYGISEGSITVTDGETQIINKSFEDSYAGYHYHVLGNSYAVSLDDFDLMSLPENTTLTVNLTYGDDSVTFKRVRIGDYVYKIVTPDDIAGLYDVSITDMEIGEVDDDVVSITVTGANRQSILIDVSGGYFNVYVDDEKVEGLGEIILYNWIYSGILYDEEYLMEAGIYDDIGYDPEEFAQLDEDERAEILAGTYYEDFASELYLYRLASPDFGCPELYLTATDLGIEEPGVYNIKVTHVPERYEEEGDEEVELPDDYVIMEETLVLEKDVVLKGIRNTVINVYESTFTFDEHSDLIARLTDVVGNPIADARINVTTPYGSYRYDTDENGNIFTPVKFRPGEYEYVFSYGGSDNYNPTELSKTIVINKIETLITVMDVTMTYKDDVDYAISVRDIGGDPISGITVTVDNGVKALKYRTDNWGVAHAPITLKPSDSPYVFTVLFNGSSAYAPSNASSNVHISKIEAAINVDDLQVAYNDGTTFDAFLHDLHGNPIPGITVSFDNGIRVSKYRTDENGMAKAPITLKPGNYNYTISFAGNSYYTPLSVSRTVTVSKANSMIDLFDTEIEYRNGNITAKLTDGVGNVISGATLKFTQGDTTYRYRTDANGVATAPVKLKPGEYQYIISYDGNALNEEFSLDAVIKVNKMNLNLSADDIDMKFQDGTNYTATLTDANGNPMVGAYVKVNRTGNTYKYRTDSEGKISVPLNFKVGTYDFVAYVEESDIYNPVSVATTVTIRK